MGDFGFDVGGIGRDVGERADGWAGGADGATTRGVARRRRRDATRCDAMRASSSSIPSRARRARGERCARRTSVDDRRRSVFRVAGRETAARGAKVQLASTFLTVHSYESYAMGSEPRPSRSTFARRPLLKRESWRRRAGRPVRTRAAVRSARARDRTRVFFSRAPGPGGGAEARVEEASRVERSRERA